MRCSRTSCIENGCTRQRLRRMVYSPFLKDIRMPSQSRAPERAAKTMASAGKIPKSPQNPDEFDEDRLFLGHHQKLMRLSCKALFVFFSIFPSPNLSLNRAFSHPLRRQKSPFAIVRYKELSAGTDFGKLANPQLGSMGFANKRRAAISFRTFYDRRRFCRHHRWSCRLHR